MENARSLDSLLAQRPRFRAFLISRLGSEADADDVLQNSLLKAMRSAGNVNDEQKLTAWFYRLLQNALVDHVRSRSANARRDDAWMTDAAPRDEEAEKTACACVAGLLTELKPRDAELLRRVELHDEAVAEVARSLGLTAGAASVALHRARAVLRKRLEDFCGDCAKGACLDCDCADAQS
ncbi:MAG: sigma-70 family RNA polymerase sigma factor [Candidatus Didemnitutus sp.]|nr:sigma-70 family RNA polymerase sigma factor [Candidatus Didemnitutus sp.]